MGNYNDVLASIQKNGTQFDIARRQALADLSEYTGRNTILYYSAFLQKPQIASALGIDDADKTGFMSAIHGLDRSVGLDLILHTPGGDLAATESLVAYLRSMFANDIRAIVPEIAMSAGTMVALACEKVVMGTHSSLGPIDPQINGRAAHAIVEEFEQALAAVKADPSSAAIWQPIIAKYSPTLIGDCVKASKWSESLAKSWLETGMFRGVADPSASAQKVIDELGSHDASLSHSRHYSIDTIRDELKVHVEALEADSELQDKVLTVHHAAIITLMATPACKITENQQGSAQIVTVADQ